MNTNMKTTTNNTAAKSQGAHGADQRCWLCNESTHMATRCENRCRNARCAEHRLRTHSWAECPYKTKPFCQLCGETGHGVFARDCIHRCFAHDKWLHLVSECPTRCGDCGDRGHMARSSVCSLKRDRRPLSLLDVAAFKLLVPAEPEAEVQQQEAPKKAAVAAPVVANTHKAAQQQPRRQRKDVEVKRKEEDEEKTRKVKREKEEQMRQALAALEKEKERILKELVQLQSEETTAASNTVKQKAPGLRGEVGRKTLKQSRG